MLYAICMHMYFAFKFIQMKNKKKNKNKKSGNTLSDENGKCEQFHGKEENKNKNLFMQQENLYFFIRIAVGEVVTIQNGYDK